MIFNVTRGVSNIESLKFPERRVRVIVTCISCNKEVEVELHNYGDGQVAVCPICGKLAYSKGGK